MLVSAPYYLSQCSYYVGQCFTKYSVLIRILCNFSQYFSIYSILVHILISVLYFFRVSFLSIYLSYLSEKARKVQVYLFIYVALMECSSFFFNISSYVSYQNLAFTSFICIVTFSHWLI